MRDVPQSAERHGPVLAQHQGALPCQPQRSPVRTGRRCELPGRGAGAAHLGLALSRHPGQGQEGPQGRLLDAAHQGPDPDRDQGPGQCRLHGRGEPGPAGLQSERSVQPGPGDGRADALHVSPADLLGQSALQGVRRHRQSGAHQRDVGRARAQPDHAGDLGDPGPCPGAAAADPGTAAADRRLRDQVLHGPARRSHRAPARCRGHGWAAQSLHPLDRAALRLPAAARLRRV